MNQLWKVFLFFCFAVFFLSGCSKKSNSSDAKVKAASGQTATKSQTKADDQKEIDLSILTPEEKAQALLIAPDIKKLIKMNKKAAEIFNQAWGVYVNDLLVRTNNPFSCQLVEGSCSSLAKLLSAKIRSVTDESGTYFLVNYAQESLWIGNTLDTFGFPAVDKDDPKKFNFSKANPVCKLYPDEAGSLKKMECLHLGQNVDRLNAIAVNYMLWDSAHLTKRLVFQGMNIQTDENKTKVTSTFEMIENPTEDTITIHEKEAASGEEKEARKVEIPKPSATAPVAGQELDKSNEPVQMSGDQAVDPNQINSQGEIVPLENINTEDQSTQGNPNVR